jgi:hypothetical protein
LAGSFLKAPLIALALTDMGLMPRDELVALPFQVFANGRFHQSKKSGVAT